MPKLCLELGRGSEGWIGHTQPRRIAARSIAERVAEELGTNLGGIVGYAVRFTDKVGKHTKVKMMTDGILLAEIQRDANLSRYDTIIIDEAHERSLNVDFLLGYLHQLLPRRPDLKLIVTSATIDTERFASHFGGAPIVTVEGRTHPVEIRYRPLDEEGPDQPSRPDQPGGKDQAQAIGDAVVELTSEMAGDVLVFCSGEREIRDAADELAGLNLPGTEILMLYARLPAAEQHRVFKAHKLRRIVLATNVAETSLTVPGIRSVVDAGTARISRYSKRTKVQRLPIEAISQASANQRAGRCGRLGPGVCIRLYSEADLHARPEFTEPEIQRTNLASVVLTMIALGLGKVEDFGFLDPPDSRQIADGIALLEELNAVTTGALTSSEPALTAIGSQLTRLPTDPRLARMLVAAANDGCLSEVLVIVSGLSVRDPRDRPKDNQQAADEAHSRFVDPTSDFMTLLELWSYLRTERQAGSSSRFRRLCRREFLNYSRVREWQDTHTQLRRVCGQLGMATNDSPAKPETIHRALLTGLLSHVGFKAPDTKLAKRDSFQYRGARQSKFAIAPGSALFRNGPRWVMAAELVETNRLWARVATSTKPEWVEQAAAHLVKRSHTDPHWDDERGAAVAKESVSLYGLILFGGRTVLWAGIDEGDARDLFIRHALIQDQWESTHSFVGHNQRQAEAVRALEARFRRGDLLVGEETLVEWFGARIPADVTSTRTFDRWWSEAARVTPELLDLSIEDLIEPGTTVTDGEAFPDIWQAGELELAVSYEFDPSSATDGITIEIPVRALGAVSSESFDWLVPGLRSELVTTLLRAMPKSLRKQFVPIPETVAALLVPLLDRFEAGHDSLPGALAAELSARGGVSVAAETFDLAGLPTHLRPSFRIVDADGGCLATGTSVAALRTLLDQHARASLTETPHPLERSGLTGWDFGTLPQTIEIRRSGHSVTVYPAIVDEGNTVAVQLLNTAHDQEAAMWAGTRRLLLLNRPSVSKPLRALLNNEVKLALLQSRYGSPNEWFDDVLGCAVDQLMIEASAPAWTEAHWAKLGAHVRQGLVAAVASLGAESGEILAKLRKVEVALGEATGPKLEASVSDMRAQLDSLFYPGFLTGLGARNLANVARYLKAVDHRLRRLREALQRDLDVMARIHDLERRHYLLLDRLAWSEELEAITWQLQELRVSLFAQTVGAKGNVSESRIRKALTRLEP